MYADLCSRLKPTVRAFATALVASLFLIATPAMADADRVSVAPGEQHVLTFMKPLEKLSVSDPDVVSVTATGKQEVLVTAEAQGSAIVRAWLKGETSPRQTNFQVSDLLGAKNPLPMQVQTDIRVVEVNRSELNTLGVYYSRLFNGGNNSVTIAPPGGGARGFGPPGSAAEGLGAEGFNLFSFGSSSLSIINALESGGFAYTLAEPSLVSLSGQTATFLSGGEFPIPVSSRDGDIQIEFKEFGVSLALTPTVVSEDQIILKVAPEVSELDFSSGVSTAGVSVPGLRIRRTETMVSMASGESFIISGLVSRSTTNTSDRLPGLGNIPILGAFFRSDRIASEDKELIMVVTPRLVSPQRKLPADVRNFGKEYEYSSTGWLDMVINSRSAGEPIESGLSW
ncbi:type II and III secretion system protein family protein [Marinobacter alkaliphilus]|uniref:type II and III secretion system protein family protein n=1 Tax=Marinobacter alkaliphilus TaxID=254719 RepID=UPI003D812151|nr:pilus assembly protein N-terminal domain-containing protein [Marinobacter alkaliphilus]